MGGSPYYHEFPEGQPYYGVDDTNDIKSSMFACQGVDTSEHNGAFDFKTSVRDGNIKFAFARASIGYGDKDQQFDRSWQEMADQDILRGAYHAAYPASADPGQIETKAHNEAMYFCQLVHDAESRLGVGRPCWGGDVLPLALDYEQYTQWSAAENRSFITKWLRTVQDQLQRGCILYTGDNIWGSSKGGLGGDPYLTDFPLWVPHYGNRLVPGMKPWTRWALWQWSGGSPGDIYYQMMGKPFPGVVSGTNVDINAYGGSPEMLLELGDPRYDRWLLDDNGTVGTNPNADTSTPIEPSDPCSKYLDRHRRKLESLKASIDTAIDDLDKFRKLGRTTLVRPGSVGRKGPG